MLTNQIKKFLDEINFTLSKSDNNNRLPKGVYFMPDGNILCTERKCGESRFPYSNDGLTLWCHSTGHIHAKNGLFNIFKPLFDNNEASVDFFAGIEMKDGNYFPISILGSSKQLFEIFDVKRYLIYSLAAAYYIADTDFATFAIRASMSSDNEIIFSFVCVNKTNKPLNIALTSYVNPLLKNDEFDTMWENGNRNVFYVGNGVFTMSRLHEKNTLILKRKIQGAVLAGQDYTTSRTAFLGSLRRPITSAECLKTGCFDNTILTEGGKIASEILKLTIDMEARIDYVLPVAIGTTEIQSLIDKPIVSSDIDKEIENINYCELKRLNQLNVEFEKFNNEAFNSNLFNRFIKTVQKQVDNCAMGRYYNEDMMGVRDVFQQLEQALIWDGKKSREKMLLALSFLDPSGRAPRQFSLPLKEGESPKMDLRAFIDQGNWIISCFYSYLCWTNDYSILNENIGYYEIVDNSTVKLSKQKNSVLQHLLKIVNYLESNLDTEDGTNCLKILYGDWNDALDGLGKTKDKSKQFGTGVSVMASLHFYQNLFEISEILKNIGGYDDIISHFEDVRKLLRDGLIKYAVDVNENNEKRLIHGWGDHMSYKIGSFNDSDGESRISFAPNAFWVSSGLIKETPELKEVIINSLKCLESRFGLKTLTPKFDLDTPGVGRIATLLPGTAENDCVYIHASMFSVLALFGLGESEYAWKQFVKILPISNEQITKTPFVMSNSYLDNPKYGLNGQSHIDWYTGSGTVFIKNIIRYILGICPDLNGIVVQTANKLPCKKIIGNLLIKNCRVKFEYINKNNGKRCIYLNDQIVESSYDELMNVDKAFISNKLIKDDITISVVD